MNHPTQVLCQPNVFTATAMLEILSEIRMNSLKTPCVLPQQDLRRGSSHGKFRSMEIPKAEAPCASARELPVIRTLFRAYELKGAKSLRNFPKFSSAYELWLVIFMMCHSFRCQSKRRQQRCTNVSGLKGRWVVSHETCF